MTTSVTLADIAARIDMLEIRCSRCDRAGRRRVSRLIEQYGKSMRLPDLRTALVQSCDHAGGQVSESISANTCLAMAVPSMAAGAPQ